MKLNGKCVLIGKEEYTSKKTDKKYAKLLLVEGGTTDVITIVQSDLVVLEIALYTSLNCVFDYSDKYKQLKLLSFEVMK